MAGPAHFVAARVAGGWRSLRCVFWLRCGLLIRVGLSSGATWFYCRLAFALVIHCFGNECFVWVASRTVCALVLDDGFAFERCCG